MAEGYRTAALSPSPKHLCLCVNDQNQQSESQKVEYRDYRPQHERKVADESRVPMLRHLSDLTVDLVHWDRHLGDGVEQVVEQYLHWEHRQER